MAYQPQIVGVPVWYQAAWTDSRTKAFSLTNAVWSQLPQQPPATLERRFLSALKANATTGTPPSHRPGDLPVILYSAK